MAIAAPTAWSGVSVSPRRTTDRTTVSPPNAATMPLTTAIGPNWRPVKYDEVGAGPDEPEQARRARSSAASVGSVVAGGDEDARANMTAVTDCIPAVTRRLPMTRLPSAVMTSSVPQNEGGPRPVRSPKGIGAA